MTSEQTPIKLEDVAPNWKAENQTNTIARMRGKQNSRVVAETTEFGTLFSKSAKKIPGKRDTVAGLSHEFKILQKLKATEVTPEPLLFKTNTDATEAHLLMNTVQGSSFEKRFEPSEFEKENFDQIMLCTQKAMQKVHAEGVFVGDINSGTFLLNEDESNQTVETKVVDFELAAEVDQLGDKNIQEYLKRFYKDDVGLTLYLQQNSSITPEIATLAEQYLTAKTVVDFFVGPDYTQTIDISELPQDLQDNYLQQLEVLRPQIEAVVQTELAEDFATRQQNGETLYASLDELLTDRYESQLQLRINQAMINITLPTLLERSGVTSDPKMIEHLAKTLSPDLNQRPKT